MELSSVLFVMTLVVLDPAGTVQMVQLPPAPTYESVQACNRGLEETFEDLGFKPVGSNEIGGQIYFRLGGEPGAENPHRLYAICAQQL